MKIAAYIHPLRIGPQPSGVGKHIGNMIEQLAHQPDLDLRLLADERDWNSFVRQMPDHPVGRLPVTTIKTRRAIIEKAWSIFGMPRVEKWTGPVDWVYAPMEAHLPTRNTRFAVTVHCSYWYERHLKRYSRMKAERARWRLRFWRTIRNRDVLWLAVSEFMKQRLIEYYGVRSDRIEIVYNGIEQVYYDIGEKNIQKDQQSPKSDHKPYVVTVGGLTYRKGAEHILNFARYLTETRRNLEIQVAGPGEAEYEREAGKYECIKLLGYRGLTTGLPEILQNSVALYYPTMHDTFGIPVGEAMAAGVPVVASNHPSMREIVGDAGRLIDPSDPLETWNLIQAMMETPEIRAQMRARGRQRSEEFRWSRCAERLVNALKKHQ